jgi:hypothetical protein
LGVEFLPFLLEDLVANALMLPDRLIVELSAAAPALMQI